MNEDYKTTPIHKKNVQRNKRHDRERDRKTKMKILQSTKLESEQQMFNLQIDLS